LASQSWPLTEFFSRQQTVAAAEKKDGFSRPNEKRRHETKNSLSATQLLNSTKILFRQQKSLATNKKKQLGHNKNSFFGNKNPWQQTKKKQLGHNKNSFSSGKLGPPYLPGQDGILKFTLERITAREGRKERPSKSEKQRKVSTAWQQRQPGRDKRKKKEKPNNGRHTELE